MGSRYFASAKTCGIVRYLRRQTIRLDRDCLLKESATHSRYEGYEHRLSPNLRLPACLQREKYVAEAVESILNQTLGDFEFLILDDGSTDGSLEILRRYADRDPRIHLTSRANKGVVASLNELLDQARGEFIARMDADDVAMPERFQKQVDFLRATPGTSWSEARCKSSTPRGIRSASGAQCRIMR